MVFVMSCVRYWVLHAFVHFAAFVGSKDRGRQGGGGSDCLPVYGPLHEGHVPFVVRGTWNLVHHTGYMPAHICYWSLHAPSQLLLDPVFRQRPTLWRARVRTTTAIRNRCCCCTTSGTTLRVICTSGRIPLVSACHIYVREFGSKHPPGGTPATAIHPPTPADMITC